MNEVERGNGANNAPVCAGDAGWERIPLFDETDGITRTAGDRVFLGEMLLLFADSNSGEDERLRDLAAGGEWESAMKIAHSFKGSSGNLGLLRLAERARRAETTLAERMEHGVGADDDALRSAVFALADLAAESMELARREGAILSGGDGA